MKPLNRLFVVVAFLVLLLAAFHLTGLREPFNLAYVRQTFAGNAATGVLIFVVLFAMGNLVQVPGAVFLAAAVLALGEVWGGVTTYAAAVVSCVFTFWLIRLLGGDALRKIRGKWAVRLLGGLDAHPVKSIVLMRTLMQTAPALNYALALSGVRFRSYLIGTLLGLPLPIALYCIFFDYLARALHVPGY